MKQIAETYDAQGLPGAFHSAAAAVYKALASFKDIVRNSLNTRSSTPRQRSGSMGGGLTLPAVVSALCSVMRNRGLRIATTHGGGSSSSGAKASTSRWVGCGIFGDVAGE